MSDLLPIGWAQVPIGTFARIVGGGTPPSKDPANFAPVGQGIPWITPADLSGYRAQTIERGARDLSSVGLATCGATLMPKGTVLFSSRAPIGYVAIAANEISTNQGFKSFVLPDGFDPRFTYYQLKHLKPEAEAIATGTTFKELSGSTAATLPFKVAPLPEQTRIADQLDKLLARIQACNDRLDAIPTLLKRFRQSILLAAISGTLTEDWREQYPGSVEAGYLVAQIHAAHEEAGGHKVGNAAAPTEDVHDLIADMFPTGWGLVTLRDVVQPSRPITYGILKPGPELEVGVPYIRVADFPGDKLNLGTIRNTSSQIDEEFKRSRLLPGDLLLSIRGTVGRLVVIPDELAGANITQDSARLSIQPIMNRDYVLWYLRSSMAQDRMRGSTKGVAVRGINIGDVRALQLPLPSREEQDEIVRRVEALFKLADRIEARYTAARAQAQRLSPLLLAKAFRGELVPQDPNDEPASALLERIATERAKTGAQPRPRKPTAGRKPVRALKENPAMTKSRQDEDVKGQPYLTRHLRLLGGTASAEALFKASELPVADFYKQLAWEVAQGHLRDGKTALELADAA